MLHTGNAGEHIETHRAIGAGVVHGGIVAVAAQDFAQPVHFRRLEAGGDKGLIHEPEGRPESTAGSASMERRPLA